jgi:hypothetical protein
MLRRDLLKGLLGLIGGGLLLKDSEVKSQESFTYQETGCGRLNNSYCRNEFRMECQEEVKPGDKLYYHLSNRGKISKEPNDCFVGVAMSNKDEWGCCQVALYLS